MTQEQTQIIEAVRAGASIDEAARQAGRPVGTVRRWLTGGRKGEEPYAEFAKALDDARGAQRVEEGDGPMTIEEIERRLTDAIRSGSLQAIKMWLDLHPQDRATDADDPFSEFDPVSQLRVVS